MPTLATAPAPPHTPSRSARPAARAAVRPGILLGLLALVALNMRTPTASLPPLLGDVQGTLGLGDVAAGLLTALPVLCMALCAPVGQRIVGRLGREETTLVAIVLVAAGAGMRLGGGASALALYAGTLVAGIGIAIGGVTLPAIIKDRFAQRPGAATAAYVVPMMLGASVAPALAVPLAGALGSWQASLAFWAVPATLAAMLWLPISRRVNRRPGDAERAAAGGPLPWRSKPAWLLAVFLSLQSFLAYAYLAWLAPALESRGMSAATAGALLGVLHLAQLATSLVLPALADLSRDRRPWLVGAVSCTVLGALALFVAPDAAPWAATIVLGFGLGGGFTLAMLLMADLAATPATAGRLAAMSFLICYSVAALAPVLVGALHAATGEYQLAFGALAVVALAELILATRFRPALRGSVQ